MEYSALVFKQHFPQNIFFYTYSQSFRKNSQITFRNQKTCKIHQILEEKNIYAKQCWLPICIEESKSFSLLVDHLGYSINNSDKSSTTES